MATTIAVSSPSIASIGNCSKASYSSSFINTTVITIIRAIAPKPIKIRIITFITKSIIASSATSILDIVAKFITKSITIAFIKHSIMITMCWSSIDFKESIKIVMIIKVVIILIFVTHVTTSAIIITYFINFNNPNFPIIQLNYFNYYFVPLFIC